MPKVAWAPAIYHSLKNAGARVNSWPLPFFATRGSRLIYLPVTVQGFYCGALMSFLFKNARGGITAVLFSRAGLFS